MRRRLTNLLLLATAGLLTCGGIAQAAPAGTDDPCAKGEFCAWQDEFYKGEMTRLDLRNSGSEECIPLPEKFDGHAFVNRMDRMVTVYQGRDCSTDGDFTTYPGGGTFVPQAPFVARAIQIWD